MYIYEKCVCVCVYVCVCVCKMRKIEKYFFPLTQRSFSGKQPTKKLTRSRLEP